MSLARLRVRVTQPLCEALAFTIVVLSLGAWLMLLRWYGLFAHYATPAFALDSLPGGFNSTQLRLTSVIFALLCASYALLYWLVSRAEQFSTQLKCGLLALFGGAGIVAVLMQPVGAIDLFYYVSELKLVYHYGQNPYLVTFLPAHANDPFVPFSAFLNWPLVYGPAWVLISAPPALVGFATLLPILVSYKLWSWLLLLVAGFLIRQAHDNERQGWLSAYLLLANPLVLFEGVANAHNDVVLAVFLVAAVVAMRRRIWLALPLACVAVAIKAFALPLALVVAFAVWRKGISRKAMAWSLLASALVVMVVTLPFWANGAMISGMFRAVATQQGIRTAALVSLAQEYAQMRGATPPTVMFVRLICGVAFIVLGLVTATRTRSLALGLAQVLLLTYLFISSLFPWYLIPVIGLLALVPSRSALVYIALGSALALLSYPLSIWARFNTHFSLFQMRLAVAIFLTCPILALLIWQAALAAVWQRFQHPHQSGRLVENVQ